MALVDDADEPGSAPSSRSVRPVGKIPQIRRLSLRRGGVCVEEAWESSISNCSRVSFPVVVEGSVTWDVDASACG